MKLNFYLEKRSKLLSKQYKVVELYYKEKYRGDKKILKKIKKEYDFLREEILNCEDYINEIDDKLMDEICLPNPEDINDALIVCDFL